MPRIETLEATHWNDSHHQLEELYKTLLHLSVAFKFIAMDWSEFGHTCVSQKKDHNLHTEYNK